MIEFCDILYGTVALPDWTGPFIRLPEFMRLRGVRLSNVDSFQFKDFSGPSRWEHSIAVAHLADRCARIRGLGEQETIHLVLAGLLHDVATPPFAHTAEHVLDDFDHESEGQHVLSGLRGKDFEPDYPIFAGQSSQFQKTARKAARALRTSINREEVGRLVIGEGDLGFLIRGTIDLDNADNVVRACLYLGMDVDTKLPLKLTEWLAQQSHPPANIESIDEGSVVSWRGYRSRLYGRFFDCSDDELGRQAFLQHLIRRAAMAGFPRSSIIWNTDDRLLTELEQYSHPQDDTDLTPLPELVKRYRLAEPPVKVARIDLDDEEQLRVLRLPEAVTWLEGRLSGRAFEPMVLVTSRRYSIPSTRDTLFNPPLGSLIVFKLGSGVKSASLNDWLKERVPSHLSGLSLVRGITSTISRHIPTWVKEKPWLRMTPARIRNIKAKLEHVGDWSFRLSKNDNLHPYPGTFVYSIPSNLISALGLREELVVDPFGGTGQTAAEVIKQGGRVVSADANTVAHLAAKAKLTYLGPTERNSLIATSSDQLQRYAARRVPRVEGIEKWFHEKTCRELSQIWQFITHRRDGSVKDFLSVCFSAILPNCTGRRGKQHGYFADNTPLGSGVSKPPYRNAFEEFTRRIDINTSIIERFYASIERDGRDPATELQNVQVLKLDITQAAPEDYGVELGSVAGIITSPPYLCMADYTLGQRLSYYWFSPRMMQDDYAKELGARRKRHSPERAIQTYWDGLRSFARTSAALLRTKGFLATVLGAPVAQRFQALDVFREYDSILKKEGFCLLWKTFRPVYWPRNFGYSRLKEERVSVHVLET